MFVRESAGQPATRREIRIVLSAKGSHSGPRVVIDSPRQQQDVGQPFVVAGWAADLDAAEGSGIGTIHVWAYPRTGAPPVFLGIAQQGYVRPDVAAAFDNRLLDSGYALTVRGLQPGIYDVAVFGWSTPRRAFASAVTVQVIVRP